MSRNYRQLRVYQMARATVVDIYRKTSTLPLEEKFGLQAQSRRAAVSIACNIVEGAARKSEREYLQHLNIAFGSAHELMLLLEIMIDLEFLKPADLSDTTERLDHLIRSLQRLMDGVRPPEARSQKPEAVSRKPEAE